jgi:hypothetical protein
VLVLLFLLLLLLHQNQSFQLGKRVERGLPVGRQERLFGPAGEPEPPPPRERREAAVAVPAGGFSSSVMVIVIIILFVFFLKKMITPCLFHCFQAPLALVSRDQLERVVIVLRAAER